MLKACADCVQRRPHRGAARRSPQPPPDEGYAPAKTQRVFAGLPVEAAALIAPAGGGRAAGGRPAVEDRRRKGRLYAAATSTKAAYSGQVR